MAARTATRALPPMRRTSRRPTPLAPRGCRRPWRCAGPALLCALLLALAACGGSEPEAPEAAESAEGATADQSPAQTPAQPPAAEGGADAAQQQPAAPAAAAPRESTITIFRPVGNNQESYARDTLLEVPTGYMFLLALEVSAHQELLAIYIDGQLMSRPHNTYLQLQVPFLLQPGENQIVVRAETLNESKEETFTVTVTDPPNEAQPAQRPR